MESAFDKEAECGEFYLEFGENIWEYKLVERFEAQGACQVNSVTFEHNDGHESASNALLRVLKTQEKTGLLFTKGVRPAGLAKKVQEKLDNSKKDLMSMHEWDEKTKARLDDLKQNMQDVDSKVQSQVVKLEKIENDVQCQVVKIEGVDSKVSDMQTHVVKIDDVQSEVVKIGTYVSDRIPDYEKRLASETKQKFENMGRLGPLKRRNNLLEARNAELEKMNKELVEEKAEYIKKEQAWIMEKSELLTIKTLISSLQRASDQLQHTSAMNASILESNSAINEELQRTADVLASTLEEERAAKRART